LRSFGVADVSDHVGKPFLWVDVMSFAGGKKAVEHGDILCCLMRSGKQVVFSAKVMESFP
jgi:hypothetical protein